MLRTVIPVSILVIGAFFAILTHGENPDKILGILSLWTFIIFQTQPDKPEATRLDRFLRISFIAVFSARIVWLIVSAVAARRTRTTTPSTSGAPAADASAPADNLESTTVDKEVTAKIRLQALHRL